MIRFDNVVQNIVDNNLRNSEYNDSMIISVDMSFMEFYKSDEISEDRISYLQDLFPHLEISYDMVEAKILANFLFINKQGYYQCFFNIGDFHPISTTETRWEFTTDHDSCWRSSAFDFVDSYVRDIKRSFSRLSEIEELDHISIPKHVLPNYSNVAQSKMFQFTETNLDCSYKNNNHIMNVSQEGNITLTNVPNISEVA